MVSEDRLICFVNPLDNAHSTTVLYSGLNPLWLVLFQYLWHFLPVYFDRPQTTGDARYWKPCQCLTIIIIHPKVHLWSRDPHSFRNTAVVFGISLEMRGDFKTASFPI